MPWQKILPMLLLDKGIIYHHSQQLVMIQWLLEITQYDNE